MFKNIKEENVVSFDTESENTLALKKIYIDDCFNEKYICGLIPKNSSNNDWLYNKVACIKLSSIQNFVIFNNEDDYISAMKKSEE